MGNKKNNLAYFLKEVFLVTKADLSSNILSVVSLAFILFIVTIVFSLTLNLQGLITNLKNEAEISVFFDDKEDIKALEDNLLKIDGVRGVLFISEEEAKKEMVETLGEDSKIIDLFDYNPFSPYIEVNIDLDKLSNVSTDIKTLQGVTYLRDNKEILVKLENLMNLVSVFGVFLLVAISLTTIFVTSHLIRQGIYINREPIGTLKLLGAPSRFIFLPYLLNGFFMTIIAGLLSLGITFFTTKYAFKMLISSLSFIEVSSFKNHFVILFIFTTLLSALLGLLGSLIGIKSTSPKIK